MCKTAIDILLDKLESLGLIHNPEDLLYESIVGECKEIEKNQMKEASLCNVTTHPKFRAIFEEQFENYYNKTFKELIYVSPKPTWENAFKEADEYAKKQDAKDREENNIQDSGYWYWFKHYLQTTFIIKL